MKIAGRQGDVLIIEDETPRDVSRMKLIERDNGRVVLAYGEVTGHAHAIAEKGCSLYLDDTASIAGPDALGFIARAGGGGGAVDVPVPDRTLVVDEPIVIRHEEHDAIALEAGKTYTVRHQVEYDPEAFRAVAD